MNPLNYMRLHDTSSENSRQCWTNALNGKIRDLVNHDKWSWQQSLHAPGCRYVRLRARSRTYGQVLLVVVAKPGEKRFYLISMSLTIQVTRLIQAWNQRYWIEQM